MNSSPSDARPGTVTPPFGTRRFFRQLRVKLTLPYVFLTLVIAAGAAYLGTRLLASLLENRFETALLDAGRQAADTVVLVEREQLALWRAIAYTEGVAEAVARGDSARAQRLISVVAANMGQDAVDVLDAQAHTFLALRRSPEAGTIAYDTVERPGGCSEWPTVQDILAGRVDEHGDKYSALVQAGTEWIFYTAGPLRHEGQIVGVLLVGTRLENLIRNLDEQSLARISIYPASGQPQISTLAGDDLSGLSVDQADFDAALRQQDSWIPRRDVSVSGRTYAQLLGPFEVRYGHDLGVLGVAMPVSFITQAGLPTRNLLLVVFGVATGAVLLTGTLLSGAVVRRLQRLSEATRRLAQGDLSVRIEPQGGDEVAFLTHAFNKMAADLQEERRYRDLLGMTASPEIAHRLHEMVATGRVQLEAQVVVATILFADIRGFTTLSERLSPQAVLGLLNDYLNGVVQIIRQHGGIINKFGGDSVLAFFGVLPEPQLQRTSATAAVEAAVAIMGFLDRFNSEHQARDLPTIRVGIGINTGQAMAGAVGSATRLEYTVIGDAVNVAQRLSDLNKEHRHADVFVSHDTYRYVADDVVRSHLAELGPLQVRGRSEPIDVYALGVRNEAAD